jgi:hypothetical membrane protein
MPPPASTSRLALAGIVGPVLFTGLVILQGLLQPDYSPVALPISALAAWPLGWIQILNFLVFGVLMTAFGFAMHRGVRPSRCGVFGPALLVTNGIGIVIAGLFPWVMVDGVPTETPAHVAGAVTAFGSISLALPLVSRRMRLDPAWRDLSTYTMVTGIAVLLLFIAMGSFAIDEGTPLHPWAGLIQRILCLIWFAWLILVARRLRTLSRR